MPFRVAILFFATFVVRAICQSSNNVFINPPPKGSGKSTQTWIAGQTYTLSWNTDYADVVVFLQSQENGDDGNPRQSLTLVDTGSNFTTSPHPFLVGGNIDTSLSPFHFEVYQASTNNNFESQNVNIVAKDGSGSSPSSSLSSSSGEEITTTVTRLSISTLVEPSPFTTATTVTVSDIATESVTVTVSATVVQATAQAANNQPNTSKSGAAGALSVLPWWLLGLTCVFSWI